MQRIEFTDLTIRLRRNFMASTFMVIAIKGFNIKVESYATGGAKITNLTPDAILWILVAISIYHAIAFFIRAFEEYRYWELTLNEERHGRYTPYDKNLPYQFGSIAKSLKAIEEGKFKEAKALGILGDEFKDQISTLKEYAVKDAADAAITYSKRFENFPKITRVRFWLWDMGVTMLVLVLASAFVLECLPAGFFVMFTTL